MRIRVKPKIIPPEALLQAYAGGYFPMADSRHGRIEWYTADPRAMLPLDPFHIPRRLKRVLKQAPFTYSRDADFKAVITACAERESTWICQAIIESYVRLHECGHAHSVEVWNDGRLVGGLYGVHLGGAFFGESMFHVEDNASKGALVHLADHLVSRGFRLLEIQMVTPLTAQFGAQLVWQQDYRKLLQDAVTTPCSW
jgi:leucyl/phenylalanyl-tRNA--protein transferase